MNETFKTELAAFARDIREMCLNTPCSNCRLRSNGYCGGTPIGSFFDADAAIAAVEAYRNRKKPCAEAIDRALDVYTVEVEVPRGRASAQSWTPKQGAEYAADYLKSVYMGNCATVRVLSAKRFVLESHRESDREEDNDD